MFYRKIAYYPLFAHNECSDTAGYVLHLYVTVLCIHLLSEYKDVRVQQMEVGVCCWSEMERVQIRGSFPSFKDKSGGNLTA